MKVQKHRQDHMVQQYQHAFLLTLVGGQKHANPHREAVPHKDSSPTQRQHNTTYIYPTVTNFHSDNNAELIHIYTEKGASPLMLRGREESRVGFRGPIASSLRK